MISAAIAAAAPFGSARSRDRSANDEQVGSSLDGLGRRHRSCLIIVAIHRANSRGDLEEARSDVGNDRELLRRRHHTFTAGSRRNLRHPSHEFPRGPIDTDPGQRGVVVRREHRDTQDAGRGCTGALLAGRLRQPRASPVHR